MTNDPTNKRRPTDLTIIQPARASFGDMDALADSIATAGLIHPVAVTSGGVLIAGERRLRAWQSTYGNSPVPVCIVNSFDEAVAVLRSEFDGHGKPHECRMTWAEKLIVADRLATLARQKWVYPPTEIKHHNWVRDGIAYFLGVSHTSYEAIRSIHKSANESPHPSVRAIAEQQAESIELGASVRPAYRAVSEAKMKAEAELLTQTRSGAARNKRYYNTGATRVAVPAGLNLLNGLCIGFESVGTAELRNIPPEDLSEWSSRVEEAQTVLRDFNLRIEEVAK